ncbi:unnamed protein product [Fasciola hepatica]|uniref:Uncharacterized protein n=1 Tax=Fasciola hepatica TaxID=6192 RepID=A0ABC9HII8_FASHE
MAYESRFSADKIHDPFAANLMKDVRDILKLLKSIKDDRPIGSYATSWVIAGCICTAPSALNNPTYSGKDLPGEDNRKQSVSRIGQTLQGRNISFSTYGYLELFRQINLFQLFRHA